MADGIKFGIIGCQHAHIGMFIEEMQRLGYPCAGVYEPDNTKLAREMAERFGLAITSDRRSLLEDDDVRIIGCAAVNNEKIDVIELCESYGKHVMIDKPAVTNPEGLRRLLAVMERGRIEIGMMLTERFRPSLHTARKLVMAGELGEIVHISMRKPHRLNPANRPAWHFDKEQSGGIINDLLVHDIDLLRWLTGREVEAVSGYMAKNILPEHPSFYDTAAVHVVMEGGATAELYADWHTPAGSWTWGDGRIFITGTTGTAEIRLEGDPLLQSREALLLTDADQLRPLELEDPPKLLAQDFLDRIRGGSGQISHRDIYKASEGTVQADEAARVIVRSALETGHNQYR